MANNPIGMSKEHMQEISKLPRPGRRPVVIHSHGSVKKLEELGFDPLVEMQQQYDNITMILESAAASPKGVSMKDLAPMIAIQERLAVAMSRYAYSTVKEAPEEDPETKPKRIVLSN